MEQYLDRPYSIIIRAKLKTDGERIYCPRCGGRMALRAILHGGAFIHIVECSCTHDAEWHLKRKNKNSFSAFIHLSGYTVSQEVLKHI